MPAHIVVHLTVKNPDKFKEYGAGAGPIVRAHGGKVISRGPLMVLCGSSDYQTMVILEFPDREIAQAWYMSDEYQALIATRDEGIDCLFTLCGD